MDSQKIINTKKHLVIAFFAIAITMLCTWNVMAQEATKAGSITITVNIDNCKNDDGHVLLGLHTAETFMKGPGVKNAKVTIENGKTTATFTNVLPGTYAIMALHDMNDNNRMDFDVNGMPQEHYGLSGNEMSFGPPQFVDAKFEAKEENLHFDIRF
ncbi:DUF2141 domain-containing protein [Sungkyunkwania multivorans]|uniref:DUF2141 domain-containing protein n=1 Tax=Sungkyunkwania multivorans TaxID=1173618 RepID=A0ABW3CUA2_9FLAO